MGPVLVKEFLPQVSKFYGEMFSSGTPLSSARIWSLQVEEILFCLHLLDRITASKLSVELKVAFMDSIFPTVSDALSAVYKNAAEGEGFRDWVCKAYNARQLEYGAYTYPKEGSPDKGTLFWEFGRRMDYLADDTNPVRVMEIAMHGMSLFEMMCDVFDECVPKES